MYCPKCGAKQDDGSAFCFSCGSKLKQPSMSQTIDMQCPKCGAAMDIIDEKQTLICPYCGAKSRLVDSDEVKKTQILHETIRENYKTKLEQERIAEENLSKTKVKATGSLIWAIIFILIAASETYGQNWFSAIVSGIQATLMLLVWVCKKNHLLRKQKVLFTIIKILPFVLIIVYVFASNADKTRLEKARHHEEIQARMEEGESTYIWPTTKLASVLPPAEFEHGVLLKRTESSLNLNIYHVSESDYTDYIKKCKAAGFTFYENSTDVLFKADNEDRYHLEMTWSEDTETFNTFSIKLDPPTELGAYTWPSTSCTTPLPVPSFERGNIRVSHEEQLLALFGDVTQEQFDAYIEACIEKGFVVINRYSKVCEMSYPDDSGRIVGMQLKNWDIMMILVNDKRKADS